MSAIDKNYIYDKLIKVKGSDQQIIEDLHYACNELMCSTWKNISKQERIEILANVKLIFEVYLRNERIYPCEIEDELIYQLAKLNNKLEREQDD